MCVGDCTAFCATSCTNECATNCINSCTTVCNNSCTDYCTGDCTGGCDETCQSDCAYYCSIDCTGTCLNGCTGTCNTTCTGGCSGNCYGTCNGCSGTCTGDCNNACTSSSASQVIADLGLNIKNKGFISQNDFSSLKNALRNEFARRGMTLPTNDTYTIEPAIGLNIYKEHLQKVFDDEHLFNSSINHNVATGDIILTSSITDTITYIQTLMTQNIN